MSDNSTADITFCEEHLNGDFDEIWQTCKDRFLWEEENLVPLKTIPRTVVQQDKVEKELDRIFGLKIEREVGRRMWRYIN